MLFHGFDVPVQQLGGCGSWVVSSDVISGLIFLANSLRCVLHGLFQAVLFQGSDVPGQQLRGCGSWVASSGVISGLMFLASGLGGVVHELFKAVLRCSWFTSYFK